MKSDAQLMLMIARRAVEGGLKVHVEVRGDVEPRGPVTAIDVYREGGAELVRQSWSGGSSYFRPEDLLAVSVAND